ncbi:cytochrome b-245 chaperone 1-like isoform X2 [Periplaneta americana]|uniref:cytochrome b-245 chaperone 1-like isoform X2 n=1 Tax=Periplaneta americana TaxID=6978 RepID=UPI0037E99468
MAGPMLKFKNEEKLHISKGPGIKSWAILIDCMLTKTVSIFVCLILGLLCMDEWEDCVMDRYEGQVTMTRSNWYDRLCCRVPEANTQVLPLSNIVGVHALGEQGLAFILTSGSSLPVTTFPVDYREGMSLSHHISSFLRLDRVEPVIENLEYVGDDWADVDSSETIETEINSVLHEGTPVHSILRQRDEIKVLSEPTPPQHNSN